MCHSEIAYVVVQFYPGLKFYFPLFQTHYHILPYPGVCETKIGPDLIAFAVHHFNPYTTEDLLAMDGLI